MMFSTAIQDLAKPQWIAALKVLKLSGGMAISQLADELGVSYMAAKQYGEDLTRLGYLERIRTPRTAVGRPEIFYRAANKADSLFPETGMTFSLNLLENCRILFGENAPERLIYQHFESLRASWGSQLEAEPSPEDRGKKLASLRTASGAVCDYQSAGGACARLIEIHQPLMPLFQKYPSAVAMDTRLIRELLDTQVERIEHARSAKSPAIVEFLLRDIAPSRMD